MRKILDSTRQPHPRLDWRVGARESRDWRVPVARGSLKTHARGGSPGRLLPLRNLEQGLPPGANPDHRRTARGQGDRHAAHAPSQPNLQARQEGESQGWRAVRAD